MRKINDIIKKVLNEHKSSNDQVYKFIKRCEANDHYITIEDINNILFLYENCFGEVYECDEGINEQLTYMYNELVAYSKKNK